MKHRLTGTTDQQAVKAFYTAISGFVRGNNIDRIALRGRQAAGRFVGGPTTFKIEGLLQLLENCAVEILAPQTIATRVKKHNLALPANAFKYQSEAYEAACTSIFG